jgi:hypothetical protein
MIRSSMVTHAHNDSVCVPQVSQSRGDDRVMTLPGSGFPVA